MKTKNVVRMRQEIAIRGRLKFALTSLFVALMLCCALPSAAQSQCEATNKAFSAGEKVTYDLFFNWKFVWLKAGVASMTTTNTVYKNQPCYKTELLCISSKRVDFFFKMRDTLTSIVTERLVPMRYRKGALEGKHYTVDNAWFSYKDGLSIVDQKRTYKDGRVIETHNTSSECIFDMLSILAQARSYDASKFKIGEEISFEMATGRKVTRQTLVYQGKQNVKSDDGTVYRCIVFTFVEHGDVNEDPQQATSKEVVTFYITDDDNHLPVRLDFFLNFGSAKAFIKKIEGNRYPLTSIVKE